MTTDEDIIEKIDRAFGPVERPVYFCTDHYVEYDEATEHDKLLASRTRKTLRLEDVNNGGWDPLCFSSAQGIAYYMPSLIRLVFADNPHGYAQQMLFHLYSGYEHNKLWLYCNKEQKEAVAAFIGHWVVTRAEYIDQHNVDNFLRAYKLWDNV